MHRCLRRNHMHLHPPHYYSTLLMSLFTRSIPHALFFFFNDTATTEIYTLSLHDALPISVTRNGKWSIGICFIVLITRPAQSTSMVKAIRCVTHICQPSIQMIRTLYRLRKRHVWIDCGNLDRKSTRLNSSHQIISYAAFCL